MRFRALHVATMADSAAQRHLAVPDLDFYAVRIEADVIGKTFAQFETEFFQKLRDSARGIRSVRKEKPDPEEPKP